MEDQDQSLLQLYQDFLDNKVSPDQRSRLKDLFHTADDAVLRTLVAEALKKEESKGTALKDEQQRLDAIYSRVKAELSIPQEAGEVKVTGRITRYSIAAIAAAVLLLVGSSIFFYSQHRPKIDTTTVQTIIDVAPGGNRATLRLSTGKVISLADQATGMVISEAGMTITKRADGQLVYATDKQSGETGEGYNTVSTPIGGQYQVTLPDGSKVWLNAGSTLTYAPSLKERGDDKRRVQLTGEAYFQIAKDKQHPFVVTTRGQVVEVLGTQFNINSYEDETAIRTTLLEGSVRIHQLSANSADKVLKPGQQAALSAGSLRISEANLESVTGWKDGLFVFYNADVPTVMRQLSRWYDVEVAYNGAIPKDLFTGGISRGSNLSTVLQMLELIKIRTKVVQTEQGKKIIVNP